MRAIRSAVYASLEADHPATVRQVFYRLVSAGVIEKTEQAYKGTIGRLVTEMREDGTLPFAWIADNTRWMRKPPTFSSLEQAVRLTAETYRRSLWHDAPAYVEVWLEKDALAGVLYDVTSRYDVPLMVTRGFPSLSFVWSAAQAIAATDKPTFIYYLGDHDPSGLMIPETTARKLRAYAPRAEIHFERVAVTPEQIDVFDLPTRPTKRSTHTKGFEGESVEVDAIPSRLLRMIAEECILRHVDPQALHTLTVAEDSEAAYLHTIADALERGRSE